MSKRYQAAILTASYNGLKVPNAPTIGTATSGGLSASVTFTAPSSVGGGAITSYTVVSSPGGITGVGASSPVTVSGLTSGVSYTFTVVANNVYGAGPASTASNSITAVDPNAFIENLFSTYLYTGNSSTQTITNGIDLASKGGLVWTKGRSAARTHVLSDTNRGIYYGLFSPTTQAQLYDVGQGVTSYNSDGFSIGYGSGSNIGYEINLSGVTYVSWTFRKQPKFFDIVTFTATSSNDQRISHLLGSVPGCIMLKGVDVSSDWFVYHRSVNEPDARQYVTYLNSTVASQFGYGGNIWGASDPTSTDFGFKSSVHLTAGKQYIAYLFAHNAGGFGLTGTDNVISCGSYTGSNSSTVSVNLGYEPQWVLIKRTDSSGSPAWWLGDTMRGLNMQGINRLEAWSANAESAAYNGINPTATGFDLPYGTVLNDSASSTYIYIAIRRGPMKVPTSGTSVFSPVAYSGTGATRTITAGFPVDLAIPKSRGATGNGAEWYSRLIGANRTMLSSGTFAEFAIANELTSFASNTGVELGNSSTSGGTNASGSTYVDWNFQRAPSFFDEVCYTGTSDAVGKTVNHNLGAVPELMIVKSRTAANSWVVYAAALGNTSGLILNGTNAALTGRGDFWDSATPTSSVFSIGSTLNANTVTWVAYLFATCAGVSKVGSYTGTGALQTVNCGFAAGARFVLIKRTDSTGDWYTYDSARGITSSNDPYLLLNSTAAEVTNTNYVDTDVTGFKITAAAPAGLNAAGGTYIFLAIA